MIHGQCSCAQLFSSWCTSLLVQVYKQVSGEASERQATCCPTPEHFLQLRILVQLGRPSNALLFKACRAQGGQPDQLSLCPWEDSSCLMSVNRSVIALSLFACIPNMDVMPFHGPTEASWICMIRNWWHEQQYSEKRYSFDISGKFFQHLQLFVKSMECKLFHWRQNSKNAVLFLCGFHCYVLLKCLFVQIYF